MRNVISKVVAVLMLGGTACVPGSSPIRIVGTFPIDTGMAGTDCKIDSKIGLGGGTLDASGGGDFLLVLSVDSELNGAQQIVNNQGVELTGPGKHIFVVDAVALSYKSTNPVIQFDSEQIPISAQVKPDSTDTRISVDIIGDKAADKLRTQLTDPTQVTQLTVFISLKGHLNSGETVVSNTVAFPIEVRTSNTACPTPGDVTRSGPCGVRGGQDGTTFACCTAPGVPAGC